MSCTLCQGAMPEGEWCRACGAGLAPAPVPPRRPLFDGTGCGHPPDPVALHGKQGQPYCHCGEGLNPKRGVAIPSAPGPVVACSGCGCHVAIPDSRSEGTNP